jgi:hypothetical protein
MEIDLGPEAEQFRAELRAWIAAEAPEELAGVYDWSGHTVFAGHDSMVRLAATKHPAYAQW